jgi:uncharacterized membrane protein (UPF0127 family)
VRKTTASACLVLLGLLPSQVTARPREIAFQPHAPVQIVRCAARVDIIDHASTRTVTYRQSIRVQNRSPKAVTGVDFAVIGLNSAESPVAAMTTSTKWNRGPLTSLHYDYANLKTVERVPRYNFVEYWDTARYIECSLTRVHFADGSVWKDVSVIELAQNASPDACIYNAPAPAGEIDVVAEECDAAGHMAPADVATASRLQSGPSPRRPVPRRLARALAQATRRPSAAPTPLAAPEAATVEPGPTLVATPPPTQVRSDGTIAIAAPSATLSLEYLANPAARAVGLMGRTSLAAHTGALFDFARDGYRGIWMKDVGIPLDIVFIARDGTITGTSTLRASPVGEPDRSIPLIKGFGAYIIAIPAGEAAADGLVTGTHLPGLPQGASS